MGRAPGARLEPAGVSAERIEDPKRGGERAWKNGRGITPLRSWEGWRRDPRRDRVAMAGRTSRKRGGSPLSSGRSVKNMNRNVACIGAGHWGRNLIRNFDSLGALGWVCEVDPETRSQLAPHYAKARFTDSLDEVLDDARVTAVAIATPAETHSQIVRAALSKGKDVFVEKPLCLSVAEGRELVELAADRKRILMVGHLLQYHPAIEKLKELVHGGELGRLEYIYSSRLNLGRIRREENILWSFAPHDLSVILSLVGQPPDSVRAHG